MITREKIKSLFREAQFRPGLLAAFVNPFYIARKELYRHIRSLAMEIRGKTLDVGCGQKPYEALFPSSEYIGLEIDTPENRKRKKADVYYDGSVFPFAEAEFDSVVINEVFEHVFHPDAFLSEVGRVLKPDGVLLMTVPFVWEEHDSPRDFVRYSSFGLSAILQRHGFQVVVLRKSVDDIRVVFQLLTGYIYKKTVTRSPIINILLTLLLIAPFNLLGEILGIILPRNGDLYLDNVVLARKARTSG
jgi:SAM-dependent methyltransferase